MTWIIIIGAILLAFFVSGKISDSIEVKEQGGLYLKYKELIDYFIGIPNIQVERRSSTSITLAVKDTSVSTRFTISHAFENVNVLWSHNSVVYGNHSLSWQFREGMPQYQMIDTIESELEIYQKNLIKNI